MRLRDCCWLALLCANFAHAGQSAPLPRAAKESTTTYVLKPAIGESAQAEVGETLYSEAASTLTKDFEGTVLNAASAKMENYELNIMAGSIRPIVLRPGDSRPMMCFPVKKSAFKAIFGGRVYNGCLVDTKGNKTFDTATFEHQLGDFPLDSPVAYSVRTLETASLEQDKFQIDVLYQGLSKGEVKISYRESINGMARPAFTQDVTYELGPDGTAVIGFKGMRLKVLKATGQSIDYIIERTIPTFTKRRAELKEESNPKSNAPWYQK